MQRRPEPRDVAKAVEILMVFKKISKLDACELIRLHATQTRFDHGRDRRLNHLRAGNARPAWRSRYSDANIIQPSG
jgi:hypothetical protein